MLIAEIQKRTRDHVVAALTQLVLAASLWGHGLWMQAQTSTAELERGSELHRQHPQTGRSDRRDHAPVNLAPLQAYAQLVPVEPPTTFATCYAPDAATDESLHHLVTAQRYQF
jgi:hypothetical protein